MLIKNNSSNFAFDALFANFPIMKKIIPIVVILLTFSSCIEVIEEIHINDDKSGSLSYRLESSQIGFLLNKLSKVFDATIEDQLQEKVKEFANLLKQQEGINKIEFTSDPNSMDYELYCEFADSKKLNTALYKVFGYKKNILTPSYLKVSNHKVKKINFSPMLKDYLRDEEIEIPSEYLSGLIYFKSLVYLPMKVKNATGTQVEIIDDKNLVNQTFKLTDVIENKVNVGVKIKY